MSNLQNDGSPNPSAVEREENALAAERSEERRLDRTEDGQEIRIEEGGGWRRAGAGRRPRRPHAGSSECSQREEGFRDNRSNLTARKGNDQYNYEEKYPEDPIYEETAPNARVWRTYEDEGRIHDANMVEESRDNVDVLLVFAGLFSAVVTTFVAQTSQSLQPDYAAMLASLLYESVLVQRAIANGSPVDIIASSPLNPNITFVPATADVWVNGLWFTSLFVSLTTALVAVLVKQWLHHYVALPSGTPRDHRFTRQFRYAGFQKWHVQVVIGLLPVLMHFALAVFLGGLVAFLHPLWAALSWVICAGTGLVSVAYAVVTILPILFPQCPYRTPLCDLIYVSFCRIVPQVTWDDHDKHQFLSACRRGNFSDMFRYLPHLQARNTRSLKVIESEFVQQMSTDLAAEALDWLFSASSNTTVQSIVVQSIGGLPMASEEKFRALQGGSGAADALQRSLLKHCPQTKDTNSWEPVPGMELKLERLLRFYPYYLPWNFRSVALNINSFEFTVALLYNHHKVYRNRVCVSPGALLTDIISPTRASKLPPRCWFHLVKHVGRSVFRPLDPDTDDPANMFPLHLCSAILCSFGASRKGLTQGFNSPLILRFEDALPYFLDKFYDDVLLMFSEFVKDLPLDDPLLPRSLRVFASAIKFLLHRLSLPESDMSHTTIRRSLNIAVRSIRGQTFSSQEATAVITVLDDIFFPRDPSHITSLWEELCDKAIPTYSYLTDFFPSACSLRGLQSMVAFMTINWDHMLNYSYQSDAACRVLTDFLAKRIPVAFTMFLEKQRLEFLGNHAFHGASVAMVRKYITGISTMQHGLDGAMDAATLQQHIDYLHNPHNLFTACSILATHGIKDIQRAVICRDIMTLVWLRPRDAAWDECRRKLRDLIESDSEDCFNKQLVRSRYDPEYRPLWSNEIEVEKDNIRYAMHVLDSLDAFFNRGAHTTDPLPAWHTTGRLDRFWGWCLGRMPEGTPEQGQQV